MITTTPPIGPAIVLICHVAYQSRYLSFRLRDLSHVTVVYNLPYYRISSNVHCLIPLILYGTNTYGQHTTRTLNVLHQHNKAPPHSMSHTIPDTSATHLPTNTFAPLVNYILTTITTTRNTISHATSYTLAHTHTHTLTQTDTHTHKHSLSGTWA